VVWVPDGSLHLTVHPHINQRDSHLVDGRRDVDSLVTGLISRLADGWGALPLHVAALKTPTGVVLIGGTSGAGKSTLSQQLSREFGWQILDDDTSMATLNQGEVVITPLGGTPRLRSDAAENFNLSGNPLPGFRNRKVSLNNLPVSPGTGVTPVIAFFQLQPRDEGESRAGQEPTGATLEITRLAGVDAIITSTSAAVGLNRFSREWKRKRFEFATALHQASHFRVNFVRHAITPAQLAQEIHSLVARSQD
jgi:hypothetical protein